MKEFKITLEDHLESFHLHYARPFLRTAILLMCIYILTTNIYRYINLRGEGADLPSFIFALVYPLFVLSLYYYRKYTIKKNYYSSKSHSLNIKLKFDDEYIEYITDLDDSKLPWDHILKYRINDKVIVLYQSLYLMKIVPLRAFESDNEKCHFLQLLNKYSKKV